VHGERYAGGGGYIESDGERDGQLDAAAERERFAEPDGRDAWLLILTSASLPNGVVGVAYSEVIGVAGGTGPYLCSITSGTLPAGLTLTGARAR